MSFKATFSRREFTQFAALGGVACVVPGTLYGCQMNLQEAPFEEAFPSVVVGLPPHAEPREGFNPLLGWGCSPYVHDCLIQSTLFRVASDMSIVPEIVSDYSCSHDGLIWTFKLRQDVVCSDGVPLTAHDAVFKLTECMKLPDSMIDTSMIDVIELVDDYSFTLKLFFPYNLILYEFATIGICPEHAYGSDYGVHPIGSGKYALAGWEQGIYAAFEANPHYYGDAPTIKRFVVLFLKEEKLSSALQSGYLDVAPLSYDMVQMLQGKQEDVYSLIELQTHDAFALSLPVLAEDSEYPLREQICKAGHSVTCHKALRQAMNYALDKTALIQEVFQGYATPAYSVADFMPWACPDMVCDYDVEHACALLDADGWALTGEGIRVKDGIRAEFSIPVDEKNELHHKIVAEIARQMKEIGIVISPDYVVFDELDALRYRHPEIFQMGTYSPLDFFHIHHSDGLKNYPCRAQALTDVQLMVAVSQSEVKDAFRYYRGAQYDGKTGVTPSTDAPWLWLAYTHHLFAIREGLTLPVLPQPCSDNGWLILETVGSWKWDEQATVSRSLVQVVQAALSL